MLSRLPVALFTVAASSILWLVALDELARQPVTNTGTQPTTHHVDR
jgi:hypothetical protein